MISDDVCRLAASGCIISLSSVVLYYSCLRASSIYFFEMDTTTVLFVSKRHAAVFPVCLSVLLYLVYLGTKRSVALQKQRELLKAKETLMRSRSCSASMSVVGSRKASRQQSYTGESTRKASFSYTDENQAEQARRLKRLLSAIEEQDTIQSQKQFSTFEPEDIEETLERSADTPVPDESNRFTVEKVEEPKIILPPDSDVVRPRVRGISESHSANEPIESETKYGGEKPFETWNRPSYCDTPSVFDLDDEEPDVETIDIYRQLGDADLLTYTLSALNILPNMENGPHIVLRVNILDLLAEVFAVHVPVWGCVAALYIMVLETLNINLAYYNYYHESLLTYSALGVSVAFGVLHELRGNWITNDILAFASIYIAVSRLQAVSYQTGFVFIFGMAIFDLFWLYVIDLLSTVTTESRAPLMIMIPRNLEGQKQSLATLDIMVPGVFLCVVLKYSSMYDSGLFIWTFYAVIASLVATMAFAVWRHKITPAMVLPAIGAIAASLGLAIHRQDLWRFMIRH